MNSSPVDLRRCRSHLDLGLGGADVSYRRPKSRPIEVPRELRPGSARRDNERGVGDVRLGAVRPTITRPRARRPARFFREGRSPSPVVTERRYMRPQIAGSAGRTIPHPGTPPTHRSPTGKTVSRKVQEFQSPSLSGRLRRPPDRLLSLLLPSPLLISSSRKMTATS